MAWPLHPDDFTALKLSLPAAVGFPHTVCICPFKAAT